MRRRTFWAALLMVVLALTVGSVATPDAQAASMHPKIKQRYDQLMYRPTDGAVAPGRFRSQTAIGGGWWARFDHADLLYHPDLGAVYAIQGDIRRRWTSLGGVKTVGFPRSDERQEPMGYFARSTLFTNGELHTQGGTHTYWLRGGILRAWRALPVADRKKLGHVDSDELGDVGGTRMTIFRNGGIYWTNGRVDVMAGESAVMARNGVDHRHLGLLLGKDRSTAIPKLRRSPFSNGSVWWYPRGDLLGFTHGAIDRRYLTRTTVLGPVLDYGEIAGRCGQEQRFARGVLVWSRSLGLREVSGDIHAQLRRRALTTAAGCPLSDAQRRSDGSVRQEFAAAQVTWVPITRKLSVRYRTAMEVRVTGDADYPVSVLVRTLGGFDGAQSANGTTLIRKNGRTVWTCDHADGPFCDPVIPPGSYRAEYLGTSSHFPVSATFTVR